jgi:hypothetical protein
MGNCEAKTAAVAGPPPQQPRADYIFTVTSNGDNLNVQGSTSKNNIIAFVYRQAQRDLISVTAGGGEQRYCLRDGVESTRIYRRGNETVQIHWNLGRC